MKTIYQKYTKESQRQFRFFIINHTGNNFRHTFIQLTTPIILWFIQIQSVLIFYINTLCN